MKIGFIGLGKLGLPVALACESKGHTVLGTDINDRTLRNIRFKTLTYREEGARELLQKSKIQLKTIDKIIQESDIIFVPIQTPHEKKYEGITRIPKEKADFNYDYLVKGIKDLNEEIEKQGKDKTVIIISTVLPGTISRLIKPVLGTHLKLCYNPFFIAMGTTINDFLNSEIILFGVDEVVEGILDESKVPDVIFDSSRLGILDVAIVPEVISEASIDFMFSVVRLPLTKLNNVSKFAFI